MKLQRIEISRSRWLRGAGRNLGMLRNGNGKMCCLGFVARARGLKAKDITGIGMPCELDNAVNKLPELVFREATYNVNTALGEQLARINDDATIADREREKQLRTVAAKAGFRFVFKP